VIQGATGKYQILPIYGNYFSLSEILNGAVRIFSQFCPEILLNCHNRYKVCIQKELLKKNGYNWHGIGFASPYNKK
jgi:hypothetical protein